MCERVLIRSARWWLDSGPSDTLRLLTPLRSSLLLLVICFTVIRASGGDFNWITYLYKDSKLSNFFYLTASDSDSLGNLYVVWDLALAGGGHFERVPLRGPQTVRTKSITKYRPDSTLEFVWEEGPSDFYLRIQEFSSISAEAVRWCGSSARYTETYPAYGTLDTATLKMTLYDYPANTNCGKLKVPNAAAIINASGLPGEIDPAALVQGPDGNVYASGFGGNQSVGGLSLRGTGGSYLAVLAPNGTVLRIVQIGTPGSSSVRAAPGPNGTLYLSGTGSGEIFIGSRKYLTPTNAIGYVMQLVMTNPPAAPEIVSVASQEVVEGQPLKVALDVYGEGPARFQWFFNDEVLSGRTNRAFTNLYTEAFDAGSYYARIVTPAGEFTSSPTRVSVKEANLITRHPSDQTVPPNGTAQFSVSARTGCNFQWYFEEELLEGERAPMLTVSDASVGNIGHYYCKVSRRERVETSRGGILDVYTRSANPTLETSYDLPSYFGYLSYDRENDTIYAMSSELDPATRQHSKTFLNRISATNTLLQVPVPGTNFFGFIIPDRMELLSLSLSFTHSLLGIPLYSETVIVDINSELTFQKTNVFVWNLATESVVPIGKSDFIATTYSAIKRVAKRGETVWEKSLTGNIWRISCDDEENTFITGRFSLSFNGLGAGVIPCANCGIVVKLDNKGMLLWAKDFRYASGQPVTRDQLTWSKPDAFGNLGLSVLAYGDTFFGGERVASAPDKGAVFFLKVDPDGNLMWAREIQGANLVSPSFETDGLGNTYVWGRATSRVQVGELSASPLSSGVNTVYATQIDRGGVPRWIRFFDEIPGDSWQQLFVRKDGRGFYFMDENTPIPETVRKYALSNGPPAITQGQFVLGQSGKSITMNCFADSPGTTGYAWFRDNNRIDGANEASLTLSSADAASGLYSAVVWNVNGRITNAVAYLTEPKVPTVKFKEMTPGKVTFVWAFAPGNIQLESTERLEAGFVKDPTVIRYQC